LAVGSVAVPPPASAQTSEYCDPGAFEDPVGDIYRRPAPAYRDIVGSEIWKGSPCAEDSCDEILSVRTVMAGPVPLNPPLPPGVDEIWWYWPLDLDSTNFPTGYPFHKNAWVPGELLVVVAWNGSEWTAYAIDRRPLPNADVHHDPDAPPFAIIVPAVSFSFSCDRTVVTAELDSSMVDEIPESFGWNALTRDWTVAPGTKSSGATWAVDHGIDGFAPFPFE
jgi:hypothetical protein